MSNPLENDVHSSPSEEDEPVVVDPATAAGSTATR